MGIRSFRWHSCIDSAQMATSFCRKETVTLHWEPSYLVPSGSSHFSFPVVGFNLGCVSVVTSSGGITASLYCMCPSSKSMNIAILGTPSPTRERLIRKGILDTQRWEHSVSNTKTRKLTIVDKHYSMIKGPQQTRLYLPQLPSLLWTGAFLRTRCILEAPTTNQ